MMAGNERFDDSISGWLEDAAPARLPERVLTATFERTRRTRQQLNWRGLLGGSRVPRLVPALGGASAVLLATVLALNVGPSPDPGGPPTAVPSSSPAPVASGIEAWTTYTSDVYGVTFGYPNDWHVFERATRTWQSGDSVIGLTSPLSDPSPFSDILISRDGQVAFSVHRMMAAVDDDIGSREGLGAFVCAFAAAVCGQIANAAEPMCLGAATCLPAVVVPLPDGVLAYFADPATRMVTVVSVGRPDNFALSAQYGGSVQLLKSILTTMDVWTPAPGQTPSGS